MTLAQLLSFSDLLHRFRAVERLVHVPGSDRLENDVEHSYQLAMLAWYIVSTDRLPLDHDKILRYALVHDLVETYAGDTYIFSSDAALLASKHERERMAAKRIEEEFPEFNDLSETIEAYEARRDPESRFVYALDKIQPVLHIYAGGGRTWREGRITIAMIEEAKRNKVALAPELVPYFEELIALLRKEESTLFEEAATV